MRGRNICKSRSAAVAYTLDVLLRIRRNPEDSMSAIGFLINEKMLLREKRLCFLPYQAYRRHLIARLVDGHFVQSFDRQVWILGAIFNLNDTCPRLETANDALHHLSQVGEFVIGIFQKHNINRLSWQLGVHLSARAT